jgi:hypothetical protein
MGVAGDGLGAAARVGARAGAPDAQDGPPPVRRRSGRHSVTASGSSGLSSLLSRPGGPAGSFPPGRHGEDDDLPCL